MCVRLLTVNSRVYFHEISEGPNALAGQRNQHPLVHFLWSYDIIGQKRCISHGTDYIKSCSSSRGYSNAPQLVFTPRGPRVRIQVLARSRWNSCCNCAKQEDVKSKDYRRKKKEEWNQQPNQVKVIEMQVSGGVQINCCFCRTIRVVCVPGSVPNVRTGWGSLLWWDDTVLQILLVIPTLVACVLLLNSERNDCGRSRNQCWW